MRALPFLRHTAVTTMKMTSSTIDSAL